jgi:hypothetical protein
LQIIPIQPPAQFSLILDSKSSNDPNLADPMGQEKSELVSLSLFQKGKLPKNVMILLPESSMVKEFASKI